MKKSRQTACPLKMITAIYHAIRRFDLKKCLLFVGLCSLTSVALAVPSVTSQMPKINSHTAQKSSDIKVTFNEAIDIKTVTATKFAVKGSSSDDIGTFVVNGSLSGSHTGTFTWSEGKNIVTFSSTKDFQVGETVTVTLSTGIKNSNNQALTAPQTWQFTIKTAKSLGKFFDSNQSFGSSHSWDVTLGDLDGDDDLDVFFANGISATSVVWFNSGKGTFTQSSQSLGSSSDSENVTLGDLDSDGDLDAFLSSYQNNQVWFNSKKGTFTQSKQAIRTDTNNMTLGDVDGDGDLDAFIANHEYIANQNKDSSVWLNDGTGTFQITSYQIPYNLTSAALGDLDGDGDLDAFTTNPGGVVGRNYIYLNSGDGIFSLTYQNVGKNMLVTLGDLDGDGDLDAFVLTPKGVWLNSGNGTFTQSSQNFGSSNSWGMALGDLDGDGDLDAFIANRYQANRVWLNSGSGTFTRSSQSLGSSSSVGVMLGDVDGDGDLDAFVANANVTDVNRLWLNQAAPTPLKVTAQTPAPNTKDVVANTNIVVTMNEEVDAGTVNNNSFIVKGSLSGVISGTLNTSTDTITFTPEKDFQASETVTVELTTAIKSTGGMALKLEQQWQFTIKPAPRHHKFIDSKQTLGNYFSYGVRLDDLDGDGDLDAFIANNGPNRVWFNDGTGTFKQSQSPQTLGTSFSRGVMLGDLNGDSKPDAFVANFGTKPDGFNANRVWFNDGSGTFITPNGPGLGSSNSQGVMLGDVDGDNDLDAFVANDGPNRLWLNDGTGNFTLSSPGFGSSNSQGVMLGDVNGDGDLDAFVANRKANHVWLNNGSGTFTLSSQSLGNSNSQAVMLGDVDGDGNLDAFVANNGPNRVWFNDKNSGTFTLSGPGLGNSNSQAVMLYDVDGDGDLDAFVANRKANHVWLNNGSGTFTQSSQNLGSSNSQGVMLGDVNGDNDLDAFVANNWGQPNRVWLNKTTSTPQYLKVTAPPTESTYQ